MQTFLLVPQLIENIKQNRVKGVSYSFVVLNALQDMFELSFVVIYVHQCLTVEPTSAVPNPQWHTTPRRFCSCFPDNLL
jgi:uncharacterized protein with PQ loop repeat